MVTMVPDEEGIEIYECSVCHRMYESYGLASDCEKKDEDIGGV